jgi:predicted O-methyltransferase YrrM
MSKPFSIRARLLDLARHVAERHARHRLRANPRLWKYLQDYLAATSSTGCNYADYWQLYSHITRQRPTEILECGTGVSTVVMALSIVENEHATGVRGRITSMDEEPTWLEMSERLLPPELKPYVEFHLSPTVEDTFGLFRGVRYRNVPNRSYDFVFVDGPKYQAASDNAVTFDFDLVHVVRNAENPVSAIIDKRVSTCYVLQQTLGVKKVRYSPILHLGFMSPCTRRDLRQMASNAPSASFAASFRLFGRTRLMFNP